MLNYILILSMLCLAGCGSSGNGAKKAPLLGSSDASKAGEYNRYGGDPETSYIIPQLPDSSAGAAIRDALDQLDVNSSDLLWPLSHCDCAATFKEKKLVEWRQRPGVLPHALVPDLREGLKKDPQVQLILGLPGALADLLGDLFLDDAQLEIQLIAAIKEKLTQAVPGGGDFTNWLGFRFELFSAVNIASDTQTFKISDQVAKWNLLWSLDGMWSGAAPVVSDGHLTQFQQTVLGLTEWKYLFGLDKSSNSGSTYGGLTLSTTSGLSAPLQAFDPRVSSSGHAFFSGDYHLGYDQNTSMMDLSLRGKETWTNISDQVDLLTQARLWHAAALAFEKMKPSNRAATPSMYLAGGGIIADDAHLLPLAFLPGLAALLDGHFINRDERSISAITKLNGQKEQLADLQDLSALARALGQWFINLSELSNEALDDKTIQELEKGRLAIKEGLQLVTQNMLLHSTDKSFANQAEALATIHFVAAKCLNSPFLNTQMIRLTNDYLTNRLQPILLGNGTFETKELFWALNLLKHIEETSIGSNAKAAQDVKQFIEGNIESWFASY